MLRNPSALLLCRIGKIRKFAEVGYNTALDITLSLERIPVIWELPVVLGIC